MSLPISSLPNIKLPEVRMPVGVSSPASDGQPGVFQSILTHAIGGVEKLRTDAAQTTERFLAGEGGEVHTVALATQRAELAFELFVQMRNKVVSAYQSVMQMQV
jgi:flagellar hook-basal body complex protein FliE